MKYSIKSGSLEKLSTDCLVLAIWSKGNLSDEAKKIDAASGKSLSKIIKSGDFTGKLADTCLNIVPPVKKLAASWIFAVMQSWLVKSPFNL